MTAKFEKYLTSCQHCLFFHQHWKVRGPRLQGLPREECPSLGPARSRVGRWCQLCSSPSSSRVHSTITVLWFDPYKRKRSENHEEPPSHGVSETGKTRGIYPLRRCRAITGILRVVFLWYSPYCGYICAQRA